MYPPIFETLSADTSITGIFGANPVRIYPFGEADQKTPRPYAVWQVVSGSPENYLEGDADMDRFTIQVDVYARDADIARTSAKTIRNVLRNRAYITSFNGEFRDSVTRDYRYSFNVDWLTNV